MEITTTVCNICKRPLPVIKKKDIFGIEREEKIRGRINKIYNGISIDLSRFGIDCCESCACKIDLNAIDFKLKNAQ